MAQSSGEVLAELLRNLAEQGLRLVRRGTGDDYEVHSADGLFAFRPVLTLPESLLAEYVDQVRRDTSLPIDPLDLTTIHLVEELETDHHEGRNYVRALGFRRGRAGQVSLFVEKDVPPVPYRPPDPDLVWTADESDRWTR
jgi:hypothetical protein